MGDAGEGLIDADGRIQERMEELERERTRQNHGRIVRDPEKVHALESLRLALRQIARLLHDRFWMSQFVDSRMVQASCAVTAPDPWEMRRLLAVALHAGQKSKHWSVAV